MLSSLWILLVVGFGANDESYNDARSWIDAPIRMGLYECKPINMLVLRDSVAQPSRRKVNSLSVDSNSFVVNVGEVQIILNRQSTLLALQALQRCELPSRSEHLKNVRRLLDSALSNKAPYVPMMDNGFEKTVSKMIIWSSMLGGVCFTIAKSFDCLDVDIQITKDVLVNGNKQEYLAIIDRNNSSNEFLRMPL